jgi:acyl-CoA thioesterase
MKEHDNVPEQNAAPATDPRGAEALHPFDAAVALVPQGEGTWQGRTSPAYANFIGPFGGTTAAQALSAVLRHPQRLGEPVAFTVNFAAPLQDGPFIVVARPARTNRSTQHWRVELRQGDDMVITATAVTAQRRDTWSITEASMPQVPRPHELSPVDLTGRPEFLNRYDILFVDGVPPPAWDGRDSEHSRTRQWVRDKPQRPLDFASLTALSDLFFPRIWRRRAQLTPLGTLSMTVYFHAGQNELRDTGTGYLLTQAQAQGFHNGYYDQAAQLWNEAGDLLATAHQVMYYKE